MLPAAINLYNYYKGNKELESQYRELLILVCTGIIKYAVDYSNSDNHTLYLKQDYQNKWVFAIIVNSKWVYSSELIATEGFNVLMPRFNSNDKLYSSL